MRDQDNRMKRVIIHLFFKYLQNGRKYPRRDEDRVSIIDEGCAFEPVVLAFIHAPPGNGFLTFKGDAMNSTSNR